MSPESSPPWDLLRPGRPITGMTAVLLPFTPDGAIDWSSFEAHLARTVAAGLIPAVNMDTGYVHLLNDDQRTEVLRRTRALVGPDRFLAGAFVADSPTQPAETDAYFPVVDEITENGGVPIVFQSYGLAHSSPDRVCQHYHQLGNRVDSFYGFELGTMFAPFGRIYDLDVYREWLQIPSCRGAKHSSLNRELEWERLRLRNELRPDFQVLTGNDLAIDMVMFGSDYLLGLGTFAPDAFAERDRRWREGAPSFHELNDILQYLGWFAFRPPTPAYRHSAAQFLKLRGWLDNDSPHPAGLRRPDSDRDILRGILEQLENAMAKD